MVRKGNKSTIGAALLGLMIAGVMAGLVGCPDPKRHILFVDGDHLTKSYEVELHQGQLDLRLSGIGDVPTYCDYYALRLTLKLEWSEPDCTLSFDPYQIKVLVGSEQMARASDFIDTRSDTLSALKRSVGMRFFSKHDLDSMRDDLAGKEAVIPLRVVLNQSILYNGRAVPVDTVLAVDVKQCPR